MNYGLNEQDMNRLISNCRTEADRIMTIISGLDATLAATFWRGPDADHFRDVWSATHRIDLVSVSNELTALSTDLARELADQVATSGS